MLSYSFLFIILVFCALNSTVAVLCLNPTQHNLASLSTSDSYCGTAVKWDISTDTFSRYSHYDGEALTKYKEVYERWVASGGSNGQNPTNDCLGILRNVLCAYYYPICDSTTGDSRTVCSYYCDYVSDRCPDETDLYTLVCTNKANSSCAFTDHLSFSILFVFITFISFLF